MNHFIVTGAAGFIGSHLCQKLLSAGNTVFGIDNFCDFYDPEIKRGNIEEASQAVTGEGSFHLYEGDIRDKKFLEKTAKDINIITGNIENVVLIHLAAMAGVRPSLLNPELYQEVNVGGTLNILEICRKFKISRLVFASSSSVYGENTSVPFSEKTPTDRPISVYAATKKAGEAMCHAYSHLYNIKTVCLRFFTAYGPRQRPDLAIHKFAKLITEGKSVPVFGDGSTSRDYTYIDDITDGVVKAAVLTGSDDFEEKFDIFNLGESQTVKLIDLVKLIEKELEKEALIEWLPLQPGDVPVTFADISHSREILGYNPTTKIEHGVREFVKWFKR
ncbi:MAG: GDP-mannose 4,6-dehydratase [Firmicutes bacterium]|nr:GDP-mannose 4,6-dehydratase [Bacillota bacterium]